MPGARQVLLPHVSVAEELHRFAVPAHRVEAVLVVVVVRALALGDGAPRARDVPRGEGVLEEVQGEGFEREDEARRGGALGRVEVGVGEHRRPMERGDVVQGVDRHGVELRSRAERRRGVDRRVDRDVGPGEQEVGVVRPRAGRVGLVRALEAEVAERLEVAPLRFVPSAGDPVLRLCRHAGDGEDPVALEDRPEHAFGRAGVIARDRRPGCEVDAIGGPGGVARGSLRAEAGVESPPSFLPEAVERPAMLRVEGPDAFRADRPMLGVDPTARRRSEEGQEGGD